MPNTYTQIHIQVVFTVKHRVSLIAERWRDDLYRYMTGIVQNNGHRLLAIGGMPDHIHMLIGMRPAQSLSDLMQDIKGSSSAWINKQGFTKGKFAWQEGYGAFSYSYPQVSKVAAYIRNQEEHHSQRTFIEEYRQLLKEFDISYDEQYIFKEIE